jgi:hypothetical protein
VQIENPSTDLSNSIKKGDGIEVIGLAERGSYGELSWWVCVASAAPNRYALQLHSFLCVCVFFFSFTFVYSYYCCINIFVIMGIIWFLVLL